MKDKYRTWQLADYCGWIGKEPHEVLRFAKMGIAETVWLDFDFAVRFMKRFWDRREEETEMVRDTTPKSEKGKVPRQKYKTLFAVLGLRQDGTDPEKDATPDLDIDKLAHDVMAGTVDWSEYGL